jgi:TPP-dependent pyruvate/acetoin dehydrogenase alpha subunit
MEEKRMVETQFELTKDEALDLYFKMVLTRYTENKHEELFQKQKVPVYTHLGTGQEAVGCGVSFLLKHQRYLPGIWRQGRFDLRRPGRLAFAQSQNRDSAAAGRAGH